MKVFISWSGEKSRDVAHALRDWLPSVLHSVTPFVSSRDIRSGTRWQAEIASELGETDFGLICVTKANRTAEWLNFEAGALAKAVESSRVVPIAIDLAPAEIANPLGQFQAIRPNQEDVTAMLTSINEISIPTISEDNLRKGVAKWWPDLEERLTDSLQRTYGDTTDDPPMRSERSLIEEVLESVRELGRGGPAATIRRQNSNTSVGDALTEVLSTAGMRGWSAAIDGDEVRVTLRERPPEEVLATIQRQMEARGMKTHFRVQSEGV